MTTLLEVAKLEEIVLFDSSKLFQDAFFERTYEARRYTHLDASLLAAAFDTTAEFLGFIRQRNVFTVEKAIIDFENLQRMLKEKREFLDKAPVTTTKHGQQSGQKEIFRGIADNLFHVLRLLGSKIFVPENKEVYDAIYGAIPLIWYLSPKELLPALFEKWRQFYSAAFYMSQVQGTPVAFVTRSEQFREGINFLVEHITSKGPTIFKTWDFNKYPIKIYMNVDGSDYRLVYTTKNEKPT